MGDITDFIQITILATKDWLLNLDQKWSDSWDYATKLVKGFKQ